MKYQYQLLLRMVTALIARPEFFYISLVFLTMAIPYLTLLILGYDAYFDYSSKTILANGILLEFVEACVANYSYYLLMILILTTKDIGFKKSLKMFLVGSLLILTMNILRIVLLILVVLNLGENWFQLIHMTFWYFVSSIYVFLVWIYLIKKFNVKTIPIYSDAKYLISIINGKRKHV